MTMLGNGLMPMFAMGIGGNPWTGATWAIDGNGRAYNTPVVGAEIVVNGDMETGNPPTGWSASGSATLAANADAHAGTQSLNATRGSSDLVAFRSQTTVVGTWYQAQAWRKTVTSSQAGIYPTAFFAGQLTAAAPSFALQTITGRATTTSNIYRLYAVGAGDVRFDDVSLKAFTLNSLMASVDPNISTMSVSARTSACLAGTDIGIIANLDSQAAPANFILAWYDGFNLRLDKCVAGVYTPLINVSATFVADAVLEIRRMPGNVFQLFYNGTQRDVDQTIADAGIISNTRYGIFSTYVGNSLFDFRLNGTSIPVGFFLP